MERGTKLMRQKVQRCIEVQMTRHIPCRFLHDIAFGMSIVARGLRTNTDLLDEEGTPERATQPQQEAQAEGSGGHQQQPQPQPLQLLLHVSNLSVLLPASSKCASLTSVPLSSEIINNLWIGGSYIPTIFLYLK